MSSVLRSHRCESCCGMGYRGRWFSAGGSRVWRIVACRPCRGIGQIIVTLAPVNSFKEDANLVLSIRRAPKKGNRG